MTDTKRKNVGEAEIDYLVGNLSFITRQYHLFLLFKEKGGGLPSVQFAKVIISSLARGFLLGLAALLDPEKDSRGNKNFSIFILDCATDALKAHEETVKKLRSIRDKLLAHNDYKVFMNSDEFLGELNHTVEESKTLLDKMIFLLEKEATKIDPRNTVKRIFETDIPKECESDVAVLLKKAE